MTVVASSPAPIVTDFDVDVDADLPTRPPEIATHMGGWPAIRACAGGDRVFQCWPYSGKRLGSTPAGREPTGKRAEWIAFSAYRFKDGAIVEAPQIHDTYEQYLQLGIIEPPTG